jgi:tRNA pseudouridine32 synthase/23S rRNA pseudouridine746 synthase
MQRELSQLFQKRQISKTYVAIVDGRIQESCGEIDLPLASDWPNRPKQKIDFIRGKPSKTHYQVQSYNVQKNTTYLQLKPLTGRSHQLRVHLLAVGHAIVGDDLYANIGEEASSCRLMLHSTSLNFIHPYTSMEITLRCAAPF